MIRVDAIERIHVRPIEGLLPGFEAVHPIRRPISIRSTISQAPVSDRPAPSFLRPSLEKPGKALFSDSEKTDFPGSLGIAIEPRTNYMLTIIKLYQEMEKLGVHEAGICDRDTSIALNRLLEIDSQKVEMLSQRAKELAAKQSWSVYETVSQYITSSTSIILGIGIYGAVPVAGAFLIAAGGLGLLNRAVSDSKGWDWLVGRFSASVELQQKYAQRIDSCLTYISTAMTIAGAIGAYHAGAMALLTETGRDAIMNKALQIMTVASSSLQSITRFGLARIESKTRYLTADIHDKNTKSFCARQEIYASTANLRRIIELSERIGESIKDAITASTA